jgi:CTP synthase (UTP-ammonia lyase)
MRLAVLGALVVVPLMAACGNGADTAGAQRGVTVSDLLHKEYFYQGDYLGRTVTVSAKVSDVLAPQVFELSDGDFRGKKLLVVTDQPVGVSDDEVVRVTGTVGQLHTAVPSEREPYIQEELYARHNTESYLYHATVEPQRPGSLN